MNKIKYLLPLIIGLLALPACTTTRIDQTTGQPVKEFDPVKTEQVKDALEPIGASAVRRAIQSNPRYSVEIAGYFRSVGDVFCKMSETGEFDPAYLVGGVDAATAKWQRKIPGEVLDIKNALLAIYKINYEGRYRAELPPDKWPKNIADLICASITQGLTDAGFGSQPTTMLKPQWKLAYSVAQPGS